MNTGNLPDIHWVYVPDPKIEFHRIVFPKNNSIKAVPPGKSSIEIEITCNFEDNLWNKNDEELTNDVIEQLCKIGLIDKKAVCFTKVNRIKYAYVVYDLDYLKNVENVKNFIENYGIRLCGRFSEFKYLNMDACMRNAMDMTNELERMK